jgi:hypothetical protein
MDPPNEFHHPFTPYPIQQDFMQALYTTLESKSVGIFESPTGTVPDLYQIRKLIPGEKFKFDMWGADLATGP